MRLNAYRAAVSRNRHGAFVIATMRTAEIAMSCLLALILLLTAPEPAMSEDYVPVPLPRPASLTKAATAKPVSPRTQSETGPVFDLARSRLCEKELRRLGAQFKVLDPIAGDEPCGAERPLLLKGVSRDISVSGDVTVRCNVALSLAKWAKETVAPSAKLHLDAKLTGVDISTSYQCRRRNNGETGKFSEHAFANGVDLMAFRFEKRERLPIKVRTGNSDPGRAFQAAVRGASCAYFTTVIGPTTNANHADHLHLDMAERRGGYRLCE
jgi:hypothetical protein